jgi:hypothetical protein
MKNELLMLKKGMVLGIIFLFVGAGVVPSIIGFDLPTIKNYNLSVSDDNNFDDYTDDVFCYNFKLINSGIYRTDEKPNINIISGGYSKNGGNATLTLEVEGVIEDRGNFSYTDNIVIYGLGLNTSENMYQIMYCNGSCLDEYGYGSLTNFVVDGSTLSITFSLNNTSETINSMVISAFDIDIDFDTLKGEMNFDAATNVEYSMDIKITKPDDSLYLFNREILPLSLPVVIGKINVGFEELLNETLAGYGELYIDGEITATPNIVGVLTWNKLSFGKHTLKVIAFDDFGNRASDEIEVWKFF